MFSEMKNKSSKPVSCLDRYELVSLDRGNLSVRMPPTWRFRQRRPGMTK